MTVVILPDGETVTTKPGTVDEIVSSLGFNPYEVLATANGELLLGDDVCGDDTTLRLTSIVHGG